MTVTKAQIKNFKDEIDMNRPREAMYALGPIVLGLLERVEELEAELTALKPKAKAAPKTAEAGAPAEK